MLLQIKDRAELKRIRKLLTTLDNKTVTFPLALYRGIDQTVAFMSGNMDREFSVTTDGTVQTFQMSDRQAAQLEWIEKEIKRMDERIELLNRR